MIQNRRAYQLIHCHTRSRLLAGAAAVCGAACGHADLGLYHLCCTGAVPRCRTAHRPTAPRWQPCARNLQQKRPARYCRSRTRR